MNDAFSILSVVYSKGPTGVLPDSSRLAVWTSDGRYGDIIYSKGVYGN